MEINGKLVGLKVDTDAKCNVITLDLLTKLSNDEEIDQSKAVQLVAAGGDTLPTLGTTDCTAYTTAILKSMTRNLEFHVVDRPVTPLLGFFKYGFGSIAERGLTFIPLTLSKQPFLTNT